MNNAIDVYYFPASAPSRMVLLLAKALGINVNKKMVNIMNGEQMNPDFIKVR